MQLHHRTMHVGMLAGQFKSMLWKFIGDSDLTYGEIVGMLADEISTVAKYMRRQERHPDEPDKKGDEA